MKIRILSFIMLLTMFISCISSAAFAGDLETQSWSEAASVAGESVGAAAAAETEAAAAGVLYGNETVAVEEGLALANELLAGGNLVKAEIAVAAEEAYVGNRADAAEIAANGAEASMENGEAHRDNAADAAQQAAADKNTAQQAQKTAEETNNYYVATEAADKARAAADDADAQAAVAANQAGKATYDAVIAQQYADAAQLEYQRAQASYDATVEYVQEQLTQGLIDAERAQALTAAAKKEADDAHAAAEQALSEARQKSVEAKNVLDESKETLAKDVEELEKIVAEGAVTVAKDTAVTAVTGAVLLAADIAQDLADLEVANLEKNMEKIQGQIDELDAALADAEGQIAELEKKIAEGEVDKAAAEKTMEALQKAKDEAQTEKDNAQAVLDAHKLATDTGFDTTLTDLQAKVKDGSATKDDIKDLAEAVLGNLNTYDKNVANYTNIEPVEGQENIFSYKDAEGKTKYFEARIVEGEDGVKVLQFFPAAQQSVEKTLESSYPSETFTKSKNESYELYNVSYTGYVLVGTDENGKSYNIRVKSSQGKVTGNTEYTLQTENDGNVKFDKSGNPYVEKEVQEGTRTVHHDEIKIVKKVIKEAYDEEVPNMVTKQFFLTITKDGKPIPVVFEASDKQDYDSNFINRKWKEADEADAKLAEATQAAEAAVKTYNEKSQIVENLNNDLVKIMNDNAASLETRNNLKTELRALDKELNGTVFDEVIRGVISGDSTESTKQIKELNEVSRALIAEKAARDLLETKKRLTPYLFTEKNQKELDELNGRIEEKETYLEDKLGVEDASSLLKILDDLAKGAVDQSKGEDIKTLIESTMTGNFGVDEVSAIVDLLTGDGVPAKTKSVIIDRIQELAEQAHENAIEQLKTDVEKSAKAVADQGHKIEKDTAAFLDAELKYQVARAEEELAELKEAAASRLAVKATEADEAAKQAVEDYKTLLATELDKTELNRAKAASEAANKDAEEAWQNAREAQVLAQKARRSAIKAKKAAQQAYDACLRFVSYDGGINWNALKAINPDIVAWIRIPGTNIDYPIVQGKDNEYYISHNFEGFEDSKGCIFLNTACASDFSGVNSVLFGNNVDGEMFSQLTKYTDAAFLNNHKLVQILTPNGNHSYEVNTANTVDAKDDSFWSQPDGSRTLTLCTPVDGSNAQNVVVTCTHK